MPRKPPAENAQDSPPVEVAPPALVADVPLRLEWRSPAELAENPQNWRTHPEPQMTALSDVMADVGWAGACLYNERTGRLIDGHLRKKWALAEGIDRVPVLIGSWNEADEAKILATLDPLAGLAEADPEKLNAPLHDVSVIDGAVAKMLSDLAETAGTKADGTAGADGGEGPACEYPLTPVPGEKYDYVLIFCDNESDYANLQTVLKIVPRRDYKSTSVAAGRVIRYREFKAALEEWVKHGAHGGDPVGRPAGPGEGGPGDQR
jgi:hypothetical protein